MSKIDLGSMSHFQAISPRLRALFICVLILAIYYSVLIHNPILSLDDQSILNPLRDVHSLADYTSPQKKYLILDIQPVRDASLMADLYFEKATGYFTGDLQNILIWLGCLWIFFKICQLVFCDQLYALLAVFYVGFHPVSVNSVAWLSSRKHLLSAFFILICTWLALGWRQADKNLFGTKFIAVALFFILSLLSQPINCLWIVWFLGYAFFYWRDQLQLKNLTYFCGLFLVSGVIIWLNQKYYSGANFSANYVAPKFWESGDALDLKLMTFGRYFFQLALPFWPSVLSYDPWSLKNSVGLVFIPLIYLCFYKKLSKKFIGVWTLFLFLPLAVVTLRMTSAYALDTYLLTPLFAWTLLIIFYFKCLNKKIISTLLIILILLQGFTTYQQAQAWASDDSIDERAYNVEKSPAHMNLYAGYLLRTKQYGKTLEMGLKMYDTHLVEFYADNAIGASLYFIQNLSWSSKYKILMEHPSAYPIHKYYEGALLLQMDNWDQALNAYDDLLNRHSVDELRANFIPFGQVKKEVNLICTQSGRRQCEGLQEKLENLTHIYD